MDGGAEDGQEELRSAEQWQAIIAEYESSGLSREAFCSTRKLNVDYFGKRLRLSKKAQPAGPELMSVRVRSEGIADLAAALPR